MRYIVPVGAQIYCSKHTVAQIEQWRTSDEENYPEFYKSALAKKLTVYSLHDLVDGFNKDMYYYFKLPENDRGVDHIAVRTRSVEIIK